MQYELLYDAILNQPGLPNALKTKATKKLQTMHPP